MVSVSSEPHILVNDELRSKSIFTFLFTKLTFILNWMADIALNTFSYLRGWHYCSHFTNLHKSTEVMVTLQVRQQVAESQSEGVNSLPDSETVHLNATLRFVPRIELY